MVPALIALIHLCRFVMRLAIIAITMSFISKVGAAFPSLRSVAAQIDASTVPLNELRAQIWEARAVYWYRKITEYPVVLSAARQEFFQAVGLLRNPGLITVREVVVLGIFGIQVYGCFKLGEISGRHTLQGYETEKINPNLFKSK